MIKLILKLISFTIVIIAIGLAVIIISPSNSNHYMNAVKDKHTNLAKIEGEKIVIIGGSNTAFGIDSKTIEKELGRPVFNMGIHVGLGWEYILNEVKPYLNSGDIVIMSPEYAHMFWGTESGFTPAFYKTLEIYPQSLKFIPKKNVPRSLALAFVELLQSKLKAMVFRNGELESDHIKRNKHIYLRDSYDDHGDMIAHLGDSTQHYNKNDDSFSSFEGAKILKSFYELTNNFSEELKSKGVSTYLSYPPTPKTIYIESKGEEIHDQLTKHLSLSVLGSPSDLVFPDNVFYDTRYHLIEESRKERTDYLIDLLSPYVK